MVEKNSMDLPFNKPFIYVDPYLKNNPVDSYTLPNGDKVVISKLDNMPCVQPDMRQFQIMPNLAYEGQFNFYPEIVLPDQIPNGSKPYSMIIPR